MDNETTEATKEKAKVIRAINTETVHKICSGQVSTIFFILIHRCGRFGI